MPKTICVIDDELDVLEEIRAWLGEYGYRVVTASRADEGLEKIRDYNPDLILLDIGMPEKDGFELLSELKNNRRTSSIPVLMLTAKSESSAILKAQSMKASDYITKPFKNQELLKLIRRYEGL